MTAANPQLVADIDAFVAASGMSPITFGRKALGDPHFVRDLKEGRRVWPETEDKVRAFMRDYQPSAESHAA